MKFSMRQDKKKLPFNTRDCSFIYSDFNFCLWLLLIGNYLTFIFLFTGERRIFNLPGGRCFFQNKIYKTGQIFMPGNCTKCTCVVRL
jgi:hypothetical protein